MHKTVLMIAVLLMLATSLPYLVGFGVQGDAWRFSGFVIGAEDGNSYIAKMLSGAAGNWLFRSPYSPEPQRGVVAFLPYLILGKLTAPPAQHEQLVVIYHFFRFMAGILAVLASYDFLALFTQKKYLLYWGTIIANLGGGLGWVLIALQQKGMLGSLPLDFISPESFGFLGLFGFPHLAAARALLLWGLNSYLTQNEGWRAGLWWLAMGFFQPMYIPIVWCVSFLHILVQFLIGKYLPDWNGGERKTIWQISKPGVQAILVSSPMVLYTGYSFLTDPYLKGWSRQNVLPSPHWIHYVIAYGVITPFAIIGIWRNIKRQSKRYALLAVWLCAFPFLVYAPVTTQRRLSEGIFIVLVAGLVGFFSHQDKLSPTAKLVTIILLPTSFFLWAGGIMRAALPSPPIFIPRPEVNAFLYLADNAPKESVILSDYTTGNNLPAWAPITVIFGHGPESVNSTEWSELVDSSLNDPGVQDPCLDLFKEKGIDYLFWGPAERERWDFSPGSYHCLKEAYDSEQYQIYRYSD